MDIGQMLSNNMVYGQMGTDRVIGIDYAAMREYRLKRVREMMEREGYGIFITWDAWNMRYLNGGFPSVPCRWAATMFSILCRNDEPLLSATTVMDPYRLKDYYPWMPSDHVTKDIGGGKMSFIRPQWENFIKTIIGMMEEHGVADMPVAMDACPAPELVRQMFEERGIKVVVPVEELYDLRSVKSIDELTCMNISAAIAESAMYEVQKAMRPAMPEHHMTALGVKVQYCNNCDEVVPPAIISGKRMNPMHCDFTDSLMMAQETIAVHMDDVSYNGYKTSLGRTFVMGKASEAQKEAYAVALKLMRDAMSVIRDGANTNDILAVWPQSPEFWGYDNWDDCRRFAHGNAIGLGFEEGTFFSCGDKKGEGHVLKAGMTLALETWYGPRGADYAGSIKETVLVTETGCRVMTLYPVDEIIEVPLRR